MASRTSGGDILVGLKLGHYRIVEKIGAGGMGEVYRARDEHLSRDVAIKVLPPGSLMDESARKHFHKEALVLSQLNHPNIATIHDFDTQLGVDFLVMEYIPGITLSEQLAGGPLPEQEILRLGVQLAEGLGAAHDHGVVHRDLKPGNLRVTSDGRVKILDFGLAKLRLPVTASAATESLSETKAVVGTLPYMAPEQLLGEGIDARTDIHAAGSVLYEMATGQRPFAEAEPSQLIGAILRRVPTSPNLLNRSLSSELTRIIEKCLEKNPDRRYASGAKLAHELKNCRNLIFPEAGATLGPASIVREVQRLRVAVPILLMVIILGTAATWQVIRYRDARRVHEVAVPEILRLADQGKFGDAYSLALKAEKSISNDPVLAKLWPVISYQLSLETTPPGVDVYRRNYVDPGASWEIVGRTPLKNSRQPRGMFVWKLEKRGFGTVLRTTPALIPGYPAPPDEPIKITLDEVEKIPPGMVRVTPAQYSKKLFIPGYEGMPELSLGDYWIDRHEVTNRLFRAFVDQGGYQKHEYWKVDFRRDGKHLSWDAAMAVFRDKTGRPGPKDWIQGEYPKGQDDFPVTGISWYEAAAFAEFAGKSLPTIYHWNRAAGPRTAAFIVPPSNFGSSGILPVGSKPDMSPWGNYDMAGNVKEWIWTEAEPGKRYVLGGAWDEPNYMFIDPDAQSPFLRAANIGFRCVKYIEPESIPKVATDPMPSPRGDLTKEKPASDQIFQAYRSLYSYDRTPLNSSVEPFGKDEDDWKAEKISYTAAYGNERAVAYLFLPKKAKPPFQTVVFFPPSNALVLRAFSLSVTTAPALDAILKSGRAVLYPVYKSTYERGDGMESDVPTMTSTYRDHVMMWVKDASRAIDYAETRPELDHRKLAYYGYSWGAVMGGIVPAVEPRVKVCVLALGGLEFQRSLPEVDVINFLSRVKQPVLMLNGHYDFYFNVESNQEPFYRLLGSRKDQKKHMLYETGHSIPRNELIKETLNWLDQYLGPVN